MKMKSKCKELIALTLSCVLTLTLASCGSAANSETAAQTEPAAMTELSEQTGETVSDDFKTGEAEKEDKVETKEESEEVTETAGTGPACPSVNGKLQVIGTQLCDQNGDPVQLRGISTHGLAWFPEYVNQDCINELKSWGANLLRLAMYTAESGGYCTDGDKDQLKELVRSGVEYAANADMYVIVDWHVLSEGTPSVYQSEAEDFFDEMSEEFAGYDNVIYEICNEPNTADWPEIKAYAEKIISVIRANDPDAVIIVGTPTWSQDVDRAAADPETAVQTESAAMTELSEQTEETVSDDITVLKAPEMYENMYFQALFVTNLLLVQCSTSTLLLFYGCTPFLQFRRIYVP